jgi:hypothetical protein
MPSATATGPSDKNPAVSAQQLTEEFAKDEEAAETKYKGKVIDVEGVIKDITKSPPTVDLEGSNGAIVSCRFYPENSPSAVMVEKVNKGQKVKVKGDFSISRDKGKLLQLFPCKTMEVVN